MRPHPAILIGILILTSPALGGIIIAWGKNSEGQCDVPDGNDFVAISTGRTHSLAVRSDGTLEGWGRNNNGQCDVPDGNDFVAIAAGGHHSLGLKANGKIEAWGVNGYGQCNVPDGNYIAIGAGENHNVAINSDGSLVYWGRDTGQPNEPPTPTGNDFVMVTCGRQEHSLALRADGSLVVWGPNLDYYFCYDANVPDGNFIDIAMYTQYTQRNFALREDGSIAAWGCSYGGNDEPDSNGFQDIGPYVAIDANGALTAWRDCLVETDPVPPNPNEPNGIPAQNIIPDGNGFVAVDAGSCFGIALASSEIQTLTVSVEPNFIDSITPPAGEYDYYRGAWVYINAPRHPNCPFTYKFDHWEGDVDDPNNQSAFLTMNRDRAITAIYVPDERVCGDECHPILQGDMNEDCYINFEDFAIFVEMWLWCTHPDCD